jgi:hypothetical protein
MVDEKYNKGGWGGRSAKPKILEAATIGEAKAITRCITRTSTKHAGRPVDCIFIYPIISDYTQISTFCHSNFQVPI